MGHEVLLLTRWSNDPIDFELPDRVEVRTPFKSFRAWEWTAVLPMILSWHPQLLHIFDPGINTLDRTLSVESISLATFATLKKTMGPKIPYSGGLVSSVSLETDFTKSWLVTGADHVENQWLKERPRAKLPITTPSLTPGQPLKLLLAGQVGQEVSLNLVLDGLAALEARSDVELSVFLDRTRLGRDERARLARAERRKGGAGRFLRLIAPTDDHVPHHDLGLVLGLGIDVARLWIERLSMPLILSEDLRPLAMKPSQRGMASQHLKHLVEPLVSNIAPMAQALSLASDRQKIAKAWSEIEHGALNSGRDLAANTISRIYSQIAQSASPS